VQPQCWHFGAGGTGRKTAPTLESSLHLYLRVPWPLSPLLQPSFSSLCTPSPRCLTVLPTSARGTIPVSQFCSAALDGHGRVLLPHTKDSSSKKLVERLSSQKSLVQCNLNIPWDHFHLVEETDIILLMHFVSGSWELFALAFCYEVVTLFTPRRQRHGAVGVWAVVQLCAGAPAPCPRAEAAEGSSVCPHPGWVRSRARGAELLCTLFASSFTSAVITPEQTSLGNCSRTLWGGL